MATIHDDIMMGSLKRAAESVTLRRFQFGSRRYVGLSVHPDNVRVDIVRACSDEMAVELIAYVWGKIDREEHYSHPATWWDAVKARWFPKWALKRWPAKFTDIKIERGGVYPMLAGQQGVGFQTLTVWNAPGIGRRYD